MKVVCKIAGMRHSTSQFVLNRNPFIGYLQSADKSLARPERKQTDVSIRVV